VRASDRDMGGECLNSTTWSGTIDTWRSQVVPGREPFAKADPMSSPTSVRSHSAAQVLHWNRGLSEHLEGFQTPPRGPAAASLEAPEGILDGSKRGFGGIRWAPRGVWALLEGRLVPPLEEET